MKISVITVCYNAVSVIEKTIKSVTAQRYDDYEYIIVDGNSHDGTVDVIKSSSSITRWISEPDSGIYQAMNKAVRMATGDYCIFLNAGDLFAHDLTLKAASLFLEDGFDVLTGCEISTQKGKVIDYVVPPQEAKLLHFYHTSISHQSSFIRRSLLLECPYDEQLRLVSDWKFWMQTIVLGGKSYRAIDVDVSIFNHDGLTYSQIHVGHFERRKVLEELLPEDVRVEYDKKVYHSHFSWLVNKVLGKLLRILHAKQIRRKMKTAGNYFVVMGVAGIIPVAGMLLGLVSGGGKIILHYSIAYFLHRLLHDVVSEPKKLPLSISDKADIVWVCWWQGEAMMPLVPKICLKHLRRNLAEGQKLVVVTKDNYFNYIDLSYEITCAFDEGRINVANLSDILRFSLLARYGGLWIDSTCLTTARLPSMHDYMLFTSKDSSRFASHNYISRYRWASWLIGGKPNRLFMQEYRLFLEYLKLRKTFVDYFLLDYLINLLYNEDEKCKEIIDRCSDMNQYALDMQARLCEAWDENLWKELTRKSNVHKLSWKTHEPIMTTDGKITLFGKLIEMT